MLGANGQQRLLAPHPPESLPRGATATVGLTTPREGAGSSIAYIADYKGIAATEKELPRGGSSAMATEGEVRTAEIAALDARTDSKVARLEGKIDTLVATLSGKMDGLREVALRDHEYNRTTRWVIVGLILALFAAFVAVIAYGGDQFGRGLSTRDLIQSTLKDFQEAQKRAVPPVDTKQQ